MAVAELLTCLVKVVPGVLCKTTHTHTHTVLQSFCAVLLLVVLVCVQPASVPASLQVVTVVPFGWEVLETH